MKRITGITALVFLHCSFCFSQAPRLIHEWSFTMANTGMSEIKSMCTDDDGFIYAVGQFSGTVDFDPSANDIIVTSAGENDVFIAKYDGDGNCIYAKGFGGTSDDIGGSISTDNLGNVYVVGDFYGTADFDPSDAVASFTSQNLLDTYFAKFDSEGNYVFAKIIRGNGDSFGRSIALNSDGSIYVSGQYSHLIDFDPSENEVISPGGVMKAFLAKYDNDGNYLNAHSFSQGGTGQVFASTIDEYDNVFITGAFSGTVDFDSSENVAALTGNGNGDIFIAKYDSEGNYIFAVSIGGANDELADAIDIDSNGNITIAGYFYNSCDFDPGQGEAIVEGSGLFDADLFVAKYDAQGNYIFAVGAGSPTDDWAMSVTSDNYGNTYVTGAIGGTIDFDPSDGEAMLYNDSKFIKKIFFAKYDQQGNFLYVHGFESEPHSIGNCVLHNLLGETYLAGRFSGSVNFDPNESLAGFEQPFSFQGYITKFSEFNIVIPLLNNAAYCAGSSAQIPFSVSPGIMQGDNTFIVELSDATGSFLNSIDIGSSTSISSGFISVEFPDDLALGSGYRLRIKSTSPVEISNVCPDIIEIVDYHNWFVDSDGDGYVTGDVIQQCDSPGEAYRFTGILGNGDCNDNDASVWEIIQVPVILNLPLNQLCVDSDAVQLQGGEPFGGQWSGQGVVADSFDPEIAGVGVHQIFYTVEGDGVCLTTGHSIQSITVEFCASLAEVTNEVRVFPTLTNSLVTIIGFDNKTIEIFDLSGKSLQTLTTSLNAFSIDMTEFAEGLYLLKASIGLSPIKVFKISKIN